VSIGHLAECSENMQQTILDALESTARQQPHLPAMRAKRDEQWYATSWADYLRQVIQVARGFMRLGLAPNEGVVIMSSNRPEWVLADIGAIAAGGIPTSLYTTSSPQQCRYIAEHAEAVIAVVEDETYLKTFLGLQESLPLLKAIVLISGEAALSGVYSWSALLALSHEVPEAQVWERSRAQKASELCTLIYTSGTTGLPKGVMLSHHNILWNARASVDAYKAVPGEDFVSYLPLSHIAEQIFSLYIPMVSGGCTWFAESVDRLGENLREIQPHFFLGVPRVWEKIEGAIRAAGAQSPGLRKRVVAWARDIGLRAGLAEQLGQPRLRLYGLANRLVFSKVRERLGLNRARCCFTAAAPIARETLEFFLSLGIPILEAYGMSECAGPTTLSLPHCYRTGKAGRPVAGTEIELAQDGEILIRGPHVFLGYYKDKRGTQESLDGAGWLHTGDIGQLDVAGFLSVVDRKKEIIITSGGENIAPQLVEMRIARIAVVAHAVLLGDGRKYVAALLSLDSEKVPIEAQKVGSPVRSAQDAATCPVFRAYLWRQLEEINQTLARHEAVKRFAIVEHPFTVEGGELTPTMKLRRRFITEKYADIIEHLYAEENG
jgi:long-subunit acyl-CoA synthetase (AMP-forming)